MSDVIPRWEHIERRLDDHIAQDNERYARMDHKFEKMDGKLDILTLGVERVATRLDGHSQWGAWGRTVLGSVLGALIVALVLTLTP